MDTQLIQQDITAHHGGNQRALIIGAGFIGLEMAEKQVNEDIFEGDVIGKDDNICQTTVKEA